MIFSTFTFSEIEKRMRSIRLVPLNLQKISTCKYTEITWEYGTAHLKLDTRFGLLACVHWFYSSHSSSSKLACYLRVALVVSLVSDRG